MNLPATARLTLTGLAVWLCVAACPGAEVDDFFTGKIEPLLKERCYECHSHEHKMKAGLTLDSRSGWEQGGDTGAALLPGKPDESLLIKMVRWSDEDHRMPPKKKLAESEIALLEEWVKRGAPDPRVLAVTRPTVEDWWSLKPLVRPALPAGAAGHPVDRFLRGPLAERNLAPSPEADCRTLIRRLSYDLHGLPPTLEEVRAFVSDPDPRAYEKLVDRLLASPRYGERWARHWLDTIHFAETHGCGHDLPRDHAWRFRDYVIESLNADKPWGRFVREQLAADRLYPDEPRLTPALGFLGAGVFDHSAYETARTNFDYLDRDDLVTQTMGAFVSSTANCARCHAHKFDPITQEDYYALQAVFAGVIEGNVSYDDDPQIARQRRRWQALLAAAEGQDKAVLLAPENAPLIRDWEQANPSVSARWATLAYETLATEKGATLTRSGEIVISTGERPDKETYVITATSALERITAFRLDVLADESLPKGGPGRVDNGNLTLSEFEAAVTEPGTASPAKLKFARATADFNQQGWAIAATLDGNPATGWGIYPAVGQSHYAVFELAEPLIVKPGARLTISLQQLSSPGHLIGRFKLSATSDAAARVVALPAAAQEALAAPVEQRTEAQCLALATYALRMRAGEEIQKLPAPSMVYAAAKSADVLLAVGKGKPTTVAAPRAVHILKRGDFDKPLAEAQSGALSAITALPGRFALAHPDDEGERRVALAEWIADERNPLTWRSIANRVWHYHFGRGLCDSPNDFGRMGGVPSHPELLDWLACELRESGGSLKHLHRLIVTSAAYRQSSENREDAARVDGDNRLLWRMNRLRLDADSYRDFVVATADRLDLAMGGPSVRQFVTGPPVQLTPTVDYLAYDWASLPRQRRSIYRFVWRGVPDPFMDALDFPDLGMLAPVRAFSASSLQALVLYNNPFVLHFSDEMGQQLSTPADAVRRVLLREPSAEETARFSAYAERHGMAALCRVLFNSNEFLFVD